MAMMYRDCINTAACTMYNGVINVEETESWERLKINAMPLVGYIGKSTEGLQKMGEQFEMGNEGIAIPTQVRRLANPCTIKQRRHNCEIPASSLVVTMTGSKAAQKLMEESMKPARVW
jgi:hypothetical protein